MRKMPTGMSNFPVSLPADLHRAFKVKCVRRGVTMADVVRELVRRECESVDASRTPKAKPARRTAQLSASQPAETEGRAVTA